MFSRSSLPRSILTLLVAAATASCVGNDPTSPSVPAADTYAASLGVNLAAMTKFSDDLYYQDIVVGTGAVAANNKTLSVTYTGYLINGTQFDSNVGKALFPFVLGKGSVISGWDLGLLGMKVGGKRKLVIGSSYGYGARGSPDGAIPPHSTIVFDVELKAVQ